MKVFISGLHSGADPLPGIGVARSLRSAFPNVTLIGVDYSSRSSGLSWPEFDYIEVPGNWHELDLADYAMRIHKQLADDAYWLSCLDLETLWLAKANLSTRVLVPPFFALEKTAKPARAIAQALEIKVPDFRRLGEKERDLFHFAMSRSWRVWLKGPHYSAIPVRSWPEFCAQRQYMSNLWSTTNNLILQEHIDGYHESVAFVAREGKLLHAISMVKTDTTPEGKTWAGKVLEVEPALLDRICNLVSELNWTGGGELECIRDQFGQLWLIELNPRFPAWIHGATICGHNLPSLLFDPVQSTSHQQVTSEFVRVVVEIPKVSIASSSFESDISKKSARNLHNLMINLPDSRIASLVMAHPSGMPLLSRFFVDLEQSSIDSISGYAIDDMTNQLLHADIADGRDTPLVKFLPHIAEKRFADLRKIFDQYAQPKIRFAYSIKTNPDEVMMKLAFSYGLFFEAISQYESSYALKFCTNSSSIILNGPGKFWPSNKPTGSVHALFFDSLPEFQRLSDKIEGIAQTVGFRLRPTNLDSRFGIPLATDADLDALCIAIQSLPQDIEIGLHFHQASSTIGLDSWLTLCESVADVACYIEKSTSRNITLIDVGGGFTPQGWDEFINSNRLDRVHQVISNKLPHCSEIIFELGKALAQPSYILLTKILEVHRLLDGSVADVVCDASIAEVPIITSYPHSIYHLPASNSRLNRFIPLQYGSSKLLGRLCMESDTISEGLCFPEEIEVGDFLAIDEVGAYNTSMSYNFGRGARFCSSSESRII
jgi:diaminopimelate decarboxylase